MMKNLLLCCGLAIAFTSCQKGEGSEQPINNGGTTGGLATVPATFTQKVLIETFTGAGQPQCTDGFVKLDNIVAGNTAKAIPVSVHFSDVMEIAQYTSLANAYSNGNPMTFPSGMINRTASLGMVILNRTQWQSNFDVAKAKTAKCGLAIESTINGSNANITVHCGFSQALTGNYTVTVYLLEDQVSGTNGTYDQRNAYHTSSGHPYNGLGDPIVNFSHDHVLRKVLTAPLGDALSNTALTTGGKEIKTFTTGISGYKTGDLSVVAFITKTGSTATGYEIMNAQRVKLGSTQSWD
ncbi:MAG: Omp28-related outer membrane protein [Bacteroidia bacterium]|nr:Omp28-related outer membrane protein [Bacteroidia bacterium]